VTYKSLVGVVVGMGIPVGSCLISLVAMYTPYWSTLQWTTSLATFIQAALWFTVPESPRWLRANDRAIEYEALIKAGAKKNGKQLTLAVGDIGKKDDKNKREDLGVKDMFSRELRLISLVLFLVWPITTMAYYGITFSFVNLSDDLFINFIVGSLIEIPANILVILLMDLVGRKPLVSGSLLFTGVACIISGFLEEGSFRTVLTMTGKFFATGNFSIVYIYTAELYPTRIRSTAVGSCSVMARLLGAIPSPYIALYLPHVTTPAMPYLVMGGTAVVGGLIALMLPETLGFKLPETLEDVGTMRREQRPMFKQLCNKKTENRQTNAVELNPNIHS